MTSACAPFQTGSQLACTPGAVLRMSPRNERPRGSVLITSRSTFVLVDTASTLTTGAATELSARAAGLPVRLFTTATTTSKVVRLFLRTDPATVTCGASALLASVSLTLRFAGTVLPGFAFALTRTMPNEKSPSFGSGIESRGFFARGSACAIGAAAAMAAATKIASSPGRLRLISAHFVVMMTYERLRSADRIVTRNFVSGGTLGLKLIANVSSLSITGFRLQTMIPFTSLPQPDEYTPLGSWSV